MAAAVEVHGLAFRYDDAPVLEDVSFALMEGDFVGVVGPNGGGKTTLLKLMLGLLEPTAGTVRVFGEQPVRARRRLGYVPQMSQHDPQFPVTVNDVVLMGCLGDGRRPPGVAALEALEQVGLGDLRRRPFGSLSGGQRQRTLIARALASGPDLLVLDEPTANVDTAAERRLYDLLDELNRAMTVVLVTHDITFVSQAVKTVLCVNRAVSVHPTCDLTDVTADLLREMYGDDLRVVRHDRQCQEGDTGCQASGRH